MLLMVERMFAEMLGLQAVTAEWAEITITNVVFAARFNTTAYAVVRCLSVRRNE